MILKMPMRERPEQNYLSAAVHKTYTGNESSASAGRWDWIGIMVHYVITPARRLTTDIRRTPRWPLPLSKSYAVTNILC